MKRKNRFKKKYDKDILDLNSYGQQKLTYRQELRLGSIERSIKRKARHTVKIFRNNKLDNIRKIILERHRKILRNAQKEMYVYIGFLVVILTMPLFLWYKPYISKNTLVSRNYNTNNTNTVISIAMNNNTNKIDYNVKDIVINANGNYMYLYCPYWLKSNINTSVESYEIDGKTYKISRELTLNKLQITQEQVYLQFKNKEGTAGKEMIFANKMPVDISKNIPKVNSGFWENSSSLSVTSYINTYNKAFLFLTESVSGGELDTKSLQNTLINIEGSLAAVNDSEDIGNIVLSFDELGDLNINKLDTIGESPEVIYDKDNDILRIRNKNENIDYVYISSINNDIIGCNAGDLIATNINKLFIHKDFDNKESNGYKTFALKTDNNLYIFKLNELAHESLISNMFEQLNINTDEIKVKKLQKVVEVN